MKNIIYPCVGVQSVYEDVINSSVSMEKFNPTIDEVILTLQELKKVCPSGRVGLNSFDGQLWISDFSESGEDYFIQFLEWN